MSSTFTVRTTLRSGVGLPEGDNMSLLVNQYSNWIATTSGIFQATSGIFLEGIEIAGNVLDSSMIDGGGF